MKNLRDKVQRIKSYYNFFERFGLIFLKSLIVNKKNKSAILFGNKINYTNQFWFLHGLREIFVDKVYLFQSQSSSPYIIDCGSNIGLSIIFFKQLYPGAKIIGFEPDPKNYDLLGQNIKAFNLQDVTLINKAVWKSDDVLRFLSFGNVGSKLSISESDETKTVNVEAVSLSKYLKGEPVDFLKIDIEGAEFEVLQSCKDDLLNVKNLFIEYHSLPEEPQRLHDLLQIIHECGFRYYIKEAWENLKHPYVSRNTVMFDLQLNIFAYRV